MALIVNSNIASLNAQRNLNASQGLMKVSMQRLASGLRINSAKDDAAGLAISNRMTSQIRGLNQAVRNANDGISLAQTAEGALNETTNLLQRMREIAVQAGNDTNSADDRTSLKAEFDQLVSEVTRISDQTSFNKTKLLDGTFSGQTLQIGAFASETLAMTAISDLDASGLGVGALTIDTNANAGAAITAIDTAIGTVDTTRSNLGAIQSRLESTIANLSNISENISASRSRILDADIAMETSNLTKANILQQAGVSVLAQANQTPQLALALFG